MTHVNSRASRLMGWLTLARESGMYGSVPNPKIVSDDVDFYDPAEEEIRSMIQGIYESKIEKEFGAPFYNDRGQRLDVLAHLYQYPDFINRMKSTAFRIGRGNAKKYGYIDNRVLTEKSRVESAKRYHDYDHLMENRQSYEETLAMTRKEGFYRVTTEITSQGLRYFVWPLKPGQRIPKGYSSLEAAQEEAQDRNAQHDPRKTNRWWSMLKQNYTKTDLVHWLPPSDYFKSPSIRSRRSK